MKIGYPCINRSIGCTANRTFRLKSYSEDRMYASIKENLSCLSNVLQFNKENNLLFFRISSALIPFASHPVCTFDWQHSFSEQFREIGRFIKVNNFRISMHPDQFVLINALDSSIIERSEKELEYHAQVLDLLQSDISAKIQIHVGGVYGDKAASISRFIRQYQKLDTAVRKRLVIENDDRSFSVNDCIQISSETGIPVLLDTFHHSIINNGEPLSEALGCCAKTWRKKDGVLMIDYSSQNPHGKPGNHVEHINKKDFSVFLSHVKNIDCDVMLEIKDKERSALIAEKMLHKYSAR